MTHPLTPREKVDVREIALAAMTEMRRSGESYEMCARWISERVNTALASGSGDHVELARLAEAATPGPWFETEGHPSGRTYGIHAEAGPVVVFRGIAKPHGQGEHNAAFIAAANPATVLALIAEVAALRSDGEVYQNQADHEFRLRKEAERKLAEAVGRQLPNISTDGPNEIDDHRYWLARQLLDSKLTDDEAYSIVRHFPGISKEAERG